MSVARFGNFGVHVVPDDEYKDHAIDAGCECNPVVLNDSVVPVVVHFGIKILRRKWKVIQALKEGAE